MKIAYEKASKNCHTAQHSICQLKESTKQYKKIRILNLYLHYSGNILVLKIFFIVLKH